MSIEQLSGFLMQRTADGSTYLQVAVMFALIIGMILLIFWGRARDLEWERQNTEFEEGGDAA